MYLNTEKTSVVRVKVGFLISILIMSFLAALMVPFFVGQTSAVGGDDISWTGSDPTVYRSSPASEVIGRDSACAHYGGTVNLATLDRDSSQQSVCMMQGNDIRLGYLQSNSSEKLIGFSGSDRMYKIKLVFSYSDDYIYSASQDALIVKHQISGIFNKYSLKIYKNFSKKVVRDMTVLNSEEYVMVNSQPDFSFPLETISSWHMSYWGLSGNGKYLAIELVNATISMINLETMELKRISNYSVSYPLGFPVSGQFTVSDDGKHIFIIGRNLLPVVVDIVDGCGEVVTDMSSAGSALLYDIVKNGCPVRSINTNFVSDGFDAGLNPRFSDDGGEVSFVSRSVWYNYKSVTLRAGNYSPPRVDYLALGDSYSSGEGDLNDDNYMAGTNIQYEKCHLSKQSYPFKISAGLNMNALYTKSVACSGATTADIIGSDDNYLGQGGRLGVDKLNLSIDSLLISKSDAVSSFLPGRVHQGTFAKTYRPAVITIGVGGNDVGFADKLVACLMPGTCNWAETADGKEKTAVEIKGMFSKLVDMYQKLQFASPDSKIYVVGYPKLFSNSDQCGTLTKFLLNDKERQFINEGVVYLNQVIAAAAVRAGVKYLDIESSLGEYTICGAENQKAINAVQLGDDISLVNRPGWFEIFGQESFHPNELGHSLIANKITNSVGDLAYYDYCNGSGSCPVYAMTAPEPSNYWIPNGYHDLPSQKIAEYVSDSDDSDLNGSKKLLTLAGGVLAPNSNVSVIVTSTPYSLGQFTAASDGSFSVNVELPENLEEGYHTMHIYSTLSSGESVDLYQVFEYKKAVAGVDDPVDEGSNPVVGGDASDSTANEPDEGGSVDDIYKKDTGFEAKESESLIPALSGSVAFALRANNQPQSEMSTLNPDGTRSAEYTSQASQSDKPEVMSGGALLNSGKINQPNGIKKGDKDMSSNEYELIIGLAIASIAVVSASVYTYKSRQ